MQQILDKLVEEAKSHGADAIVVAAPEEQLSSSSSWASGNQWVSGDRKASFGTAFGNTTFAHETTIQATLIKYQE